MELDGASESEMELDGASGSGMEDISSPVLFAVLFTTATVENKTHSLPFLPFYCISFSHGAWTTAVVVYVR